MHVVRVGCSELPRQQMCTVFTALGFFFVSHWSVMHMTRCESISGVQELEEVKELLPHILWLILLPCVARRFIHELAPLALKLTQPVLHLRRVL